MSLGRLSSGGMTPGTPQGASDERAGAPGGLKVVALGGGHGLAASLSALRRVTPDLTAIIAIGVVLYVVTRSLRARISAV